MNPEKNKKINQYARQLLNKTSTNESKWCMLKIINLKKNLSKIWKHINKNNKIKKVAS